MQTSDKIERSTSIEGFTQQFNNNTAKLYSLRDRKAHAAGGMGRVLDKPWLLANDC